MNNISMQKLIDDAIADGRVEKEINSWHASALGQCLTRAYLERAGIAKSDFDTRILRIFHVGNMFEEWIVDLLKQNDDVQTQVRVEWPEQDVTGYADVVIGDTVFEIKSMHSRAFHHMRREESPRPHHKMQLWTYLNVLNKNEGRLLYVSKDDLTIMEYNVYLNDQKTRDMVHQELDILNEAWSKQLPPPPITDKNDWRYKYCNIHEEHCLKQPEYI